MFGMLDYRAHKLYQILFGVPNFLLYLFNLFGIPIICYLIGFLLFEEIYIQIIVSVVSLIIVEIIWGFIIIFIFEKLFQFLFGLFVDIIPHDGRSKEEAQLVVWGGEKAIVLLESLEHPKNWREDFIYDYAKVDWAQNLFFRQKVIDRLTAVLKHFELNEEEPYYDYTINKFLAENNLKMSWYERCLCNSMLRGMIIKYPFFLILVVSNPFS
jgi:hypothetical protein